MTTLKELIQLKNAGTLRGAFEVSMKDYHAGPGISMSQLRNFRSSPKLFDYYCQIKQSRSVKMLEGAAFDAWHGDRSVDKGGFFKEYLIAECLTRKGKVWDAAKEQAEETGRDALPTAVIKNFKDMSKAINSHPIAGELTKTTAQISFYWVDEATGILCRCRPDYLAEGGQLIDLKRVDNIDLHSISSVGRGLAYYIQDAFYLMGCNEAVKQQHALLGQELDGDAFTSFKFVNVHKYAPHDIVVTQYDEFTREFARAEITQLLNKYKACCDTDKWPGRHEDKVISVSLPDWFVKKVEENE